MSYNFRFYFLLLSLGMFVTTGVHASSITSFLASPDLGGGVFLPSTPSPAAFPGAPNNFLTPGGAGYVNGDNPGGAAPSPNYVNLTANVTNLHIPIEAGFGILDFGGAAGIDGAHEYFFTVTMNNLTTIPHPIGPTFFSIFTGPGFLDPVATGLDFDPPDYDGGGPDTGNGLPVPTSTYNSPTVFTPQFLVFGGLLGGGGEVPAGGSGTFTFSIDIPDGLFGNLGLRMIPNPEPTSLALASLGMGLFGVVTTVRRRREKSLK